MATPGQLGYAFILEYCATISGTYVPLVHCESITPCKITDEKIKVQTNDSPTKFGGAIPGWMDVSDAEVKCIYDSAQATTLYGFKVNQTKLFWKFVKPDTGATTAAWFGWVSEIGDETPLKTYMANTIKIAVDGAYTFNGAVIS